MSQLFSLRELKDAAELVHQHMYPTPQYAWPQLSKRLGANVWVKHENHAPTGAFKVRGGITFIDWVRRTSPECRGICTATRGNHGQSQARAAHALGMTAKIYAPFGNSREKNSAMQAYGGELIEFGSDFDEARLEAIRVAEQETLFVVPPFHKELVRGVATYAFELMTAVKDLDTIYVPVGCGSGICGVIAARDALKLDTEIVGVVSEGAATVKLSFDAGQLVETNSATTFADGMAVRVPVQAAFDIYSKGAARILALSDDEIAEAIRIYFKDIHAVAEGAGAAPLAGLMREQDQMRGKNVAVILSGGNIDTGWFRDVLARKTPQV